MINSPLNYTGSKFKLLGEIFRYTHQKSAIFVDLFCGGGVVGVNANAKKIVLNDKSRELVSVLKMLQNRTDILDECDRNISKFGLSDTAKNGYSFYGCNSSAGVGKFNKDGFEALKLEFNKTKEPLLLFLLIIFSFNNQIRFNQKGEFNLPCGKRDFNAKMREKTKAFCKALHEKNIEILNLDFRAFDIDALVSTLKKSDKNSVFIYLDPPYFLANATYNATWCEKSEMELFEFILKLDEKKIKFAFSNVLEHRGKTHEKLQKWVSEHDFCMRKLEFSYKNCSYHRQRTASREVLITNF